MSAILVANFAAAFHYISNASLSESNDFMTAHLSPKNQPVIMSMREGFSDPLGASVCDAGINFAVFSDNAERIEVCVFDDIGEHELQRFDLHGPRHGVFSGCLLNAKAGLVYGLRAYGDYSPPHGHRFNPNKLLLDPYAREILGKFEWHPEHHGYTLGHVDGPCSFDARDNAKLMLKARVPFPNNDKKFSPPHHAARDVVLYEVHVKGFSQTNPAIPERLRGTYSALAHPSSIAHFKSLGVTTLSLLPVQYCVDEPALAARGSSNYWGYNTLGFFSPDPRWALHKNDPAAINEEFRQMVRDLHSHGIEVVLDVVYNHTPEGNEWGPTLSMRGLDNASWYRLKPHDAGRCEDFTGCGNTVNIAHPQVTRFVLDSLRYWVQEMGVDGFRFDLAPVLGRTQHGFDPNAHFFAAMMQDPVLARVHLIAEPWDSGPDGYQLGQFPGRFGEWNDKFRDAIRAYWLQANVSRGEFARRFTASSDLFDHAQRLPSASVNFINAHDGFTLLDTLSYSRKHNDANGEENRDGRDNELCANFGAEGATSDTSINSIRKRVRRSMMASLLLAQGTPMICAGDEIGKTQQGNNNAYCQDNETSWLDWQNADQQFQSFVSKVLALRRTEALLRFDEWFSHGQHQKQDEPLIHWLRSDGCAMQLHDWHDAHHHAFACHLLERKTVDARPGKQGFMLLNPASHAMNFELPAGDWKTLLDTSEEFSGDAIFKGQLALPAHSMMILHLSLSH
jgi:isoamylase